MRKNTNNGLLNTNKQLATILRKHLAVTRYAFGNMMIDHGETEALFMLADKKDDGRYRMRIIDVNSIVAEFNDDECYHRQLAEYFARKLIYGLAEYVIVTSEVGMFYGDKEQTAQFQRDIERYGSNSDEVSCQIDRSASVVVYDLSGIILRGFASEENCVDTFMRWELPALMQELEKDDPVVLHGERGCLSDVKAVTDWVLDDTPEDMIGGHNCDSGPLTHWTDSVFTALERINGGAGFQ